MRQQEYDNLGLSWSHCERQLFELTDALGFGLLNLVVKAPVAFAFVANSLIGHTHSSSSRPKATLAAGDKL